jgi:hypothetical protein
VSRRTIARAVALLLLAAPLAAAQQIFKSRTPDGRIVFSDRPQPGATVIEQYEALPPPDPAAAAARQAALREQAKAASERAAERVQALDAVTKEIQAATAALERARARLEAEREPLPGDRTGNVDGRTRLNEAYWYRQFANEQAVAEAEARLERAQKALIQLR